MFIVSVYKTLCRLLLYFIDFYCIVSIVFYLVPISFVSLCTPVFPGMGFEWYMKNIVPEIPTPPMNAVYYGEVFNLKSELCLYVTPKAYIGGWEEVG